MVSSLLQWNPENIVVESSSRYEIQSVLQITDTDLEPYTVNREFFVVKIFLDSMDNAKIKRTKIMCSCTQLLTLMRYGVVYPKII